MSYLIFVPNFIGQEAREGADGDDANNNQEADGQADANDQIFQKTQQRFQFLKDEYFKLKSAKAKEGRSDLALEFTCIKCGKNTSITNNSYNNLRRHVARKHSPVIKQYDKLWANNKRKMEHDDVAAKKQKLQPNMKDFFASSSQSTSPLNPVVSQERLDETIVEFVIATNQSYRIVEHPKFKNLALLGKSQHAIQDDQAPCSPCTII